MYKIDEQERLIIRELIRDSRISDNQIAIKTNVPLKTVNRKRKLLEEKGLISYFCFVNTTQYGTETFYGRALFIIILRDGITKKKLIDNFEKSEKSRRFFPKHIFITMVGEYEGNTALIMQIESRRSDDLTEIYNAEIVPELEAAFGQRCIKSVMTIPIHTTLRALRNYLPGVNLENGIIKDNWPNENIFVDD